MVETLASKFSASLRVPPYKTVIWSAVVQRMARPLDTAFKWNGAPNTRARAQVAPLHLKAASSRRTPKRLRRKKIQTNICQVFILCSAWGFILRPPKGGTTNLVPPLFSPKKYRSGVFFASWRLCASIKNTVLAYRSGTSK